MKHIPTYKTWHAMQQRCTCSYLKSYKDYGGRGISVCSEWNTYENFVRDMGLKPAGMSLERINNNGNYTKENCKWATVQEQNNNKRNCVLITHNGKTQNVSQWAKELGIDRNILFARIRYWGLLPSKIFTPVNAHIRGVTLNGELMSVSKAAAITGINRSTLQRRREMYGDVAHLLFKGTSYALD